LRACVLGQLDVDTDSSALPRKFCSSAAEVGRRCSGCASGMLASVDRWLYGPASHSSARALIAQALRDAVPERAPQLAADVGRWCSGCASGAVDGVRDRGGGRRSPHTWSWKRRELRAMPPAGRGGARAEICRASRPPSATVQAGWLAWAWSAPQARTQIPPPPLARTEGTLGTPPLPAHG